MRNLQNSEPIDDVDDIIITNVIFDDNDKAEAYILGEIETELNDLDEGDDDLWTQCDFLKIDAESAEISIKKGVRLEDVEEAFNGCNPFINKNGDKFFRWESLLTPTCTKLYKRKCDEVESESESDSDSDDDDDDDDDIDNENNIKNYSNGHEKEKNDNECMNAKKKSKSSK